MGFVCYLYDMQIFGLEKEKMKKRKNIPWLDNAIAYAATEEIWPCPRCGSRDIEITVLDKGRRSITLVCRKCGSWRHFDGGKENDDSTVKRRI